MPSDPSYTPTTELEAVNAMLMAINEQPVTSLVGSVIVDAGMALTLLRRESRALQTRGWSFNTEYCMALAPANDGTVALPSNRLAQTFVGPDAFRRLTVRGGKVYDSTAHTAVLSRTVYADVIVSLDWDDLPEEARRFLYISATRKFQDTTLGDAALHQFEVADEQAAWAAFICREEENDPSNVLIDSPSLRPMLRNRNPRSF